MHLIIGRRLWCKASGGKIFGKQGSGEDDGAGEMSFSPGVPGASSAQCPILRLRSVQVPNAPCPVWPMYQ
ncbi:hypothetical protein [Nostoc linckia]|uniref:hypothetical protein n=1 Tax=Nostoc linckia TaxID=92942 RepID=UPI00117F1E61|nr:hypothetical protein [Nostoc linckia]